MRRPRLYVSADNVKASGNSNDTGADSDEGTTGREQHTPLRINSELTLNKAASHHLTTVLRARVDDSVCLFNGDGFDYFARIVQPGKATTLIVYEKQINQSESNIDCTLLLGLSRSERMDYAIQKSVELGVNSIVAFQAMRSATKLSLEREANKIRHWKSVIQSAAEQSGRNRLPEFTLVKNFELAIGAAIDAQNAQELNPQSLRFILEPSANTSLVSSLASITSTNAAWQILLATGPESGFSPEELALTKSHEFQCVTLGPRVLRAETAPIAALSVLQASLGDFS